MDSTILHYQIIEKLGQGGMGVVYKAEDTRLKRTVALKFLPEDLTSDPDAKRRFMHEAQAASSLDHPNICSVHEIEETPDGRLFICMSWCDGLTLSEKMKQGRMPLREVLDIVIQVAEGLREAHREGIIHRDIKPGNIMVGSRGHTKILDFGLARIENATRLSKTGDTMGTLRYMSPEQITSHTVDHRTDIWSLGVVLYELLTGRIPFDGAYEAAVLYGIAHEPPAAYSTKTRDIPPTLSAVVERALQKNPDERYQSMDEMLVDLKSFAAVLEAQEKGAPGTVRGEAIEIAKLQRRTAIASIIAAVALALVIILSRGFIGVSKPVSIAIFELEPSMRDSTYVGLADALLLTKLNRYRGVRTLKKSRMVDVSKNLGIGAIRNYSSAFAVAKGANVAIAAFTSISASGDTLRASASLYDVLLRKRLFTERVERAGGAADTNALFDDLSARIVRRLKVAPFWLRKRSPTASDVTTPYARALQQFVEGEVIYQNGDPMRAIPHIEQAVAIDSTFIPGFHRLARWYHYAHDERNALRCARRAVELSRGDSLMSLYSRMVEHWVRGETNEAIQDMERYLKKVPDDVAMRLDLGYILHTKTNRFNEAISYLKKVIDLDPGNLEGKHAKAYNYLGHAYMFMDNYVAAESYFKEFETLMAGNADALHSAATLRRAQGRYQDAIELCNKAIQKDPSFFPAYSELGGIYFATGQWRMALKSMEDYFIDAPLTMHAGALCLAGSIHFAQEDYDAAQRDGEQALAKDTTSLRAHWLLGKIALARRRIDLARAEYRSIDRLGAGAESPDDQAFPHNLRGWFLMAQDSVPQGLAELEKASELSRRDFHCMKKDLVRGYLAAKQAKKAESIALELRALNRNDGETLYLLGCAYEQQGERGNAQKLFQDARNAWREADLDFRPLKTLISKLEKPYKVET